MRFTETKNVFTGNGNGDQLDAFRHTYWMALLCQYIKPKKVLKLGIAHEKGNYIAFKKGKLEEGEQPDSMSCVMDLINNKKGIESGLSVKNKTSVLNREELIKKMIEQVKQGQAFILLKDQNNHFLTCNHEIILSHLYKGKWSIPKCLVKSNVLE